MRLGASVRSAGLSRGSNRRSAHLAAALSARQFSLRSALAPLEGSHVWGLLAALVLAIIPMEAAPLRCSAPWVGSRHAFIQITA